MPRPLQPFPFHDRRASAVVRQSGSGRTTLHLELASSGMRAAAARGSRGRGGGGILFRASGNGDTTSASGLRGRRGWWGSARRVPSFVDFWGLSGAETAVPVDQSRNDQEHQEQQGMDCTIGLLRSPEVLIIVLGTASLLAFIVFIWDLANDRQFQPMAVLVFVAAGTYCLALLKQQRVLAAAEQALVIEIIDGSSTAAADSSRRVVISKEDRRALFHYFTFRPPGKAKTLATAEADGAARDGAACGEAGVAVPTSGGALRTLRRSRSWSLSSALGRSTRQDVQGSTAGHESSEGVVGAPRQTPRSGTASGSVAPPPASEAAMEEGRGERGEGMPTAGATSAGATMSADGDETATRAPSSGGSLATAEAGPSCDSSGASGGDEESGAIREGRGNDNDASTTVRRREGSGARERREEEKAPERGVARGDSQQWSTAGSCIVCFGDYADGDNLCRLPCRHTYHAECIDAWLDRPDHAWCPLCKSSLLPLVRPIGSTTTTATTSTAITNAAAANSSNHGGAADNTDTSNGATATGGLAPPAAVGNPGIPTGDEAV